MCISLILTLPFTTTELRTPVGNQRTESQVSSRGQRNPDKRFAPNGTNTLPAIQRPPSSFSWTRKRKNPFLHLPLDTCSLRFECQAVKEEHPFRALAHASSKISSDKGLGSEQWGSSSRSQASSHLTFERTV